MCSYSDVCAGCKAHTADQAHVYLCDRLIEQTKIFIYANYVHCIVLRSIVNPHHVCIGCCSNPICTHTMCTLHVCMLCGHAHNELCMYDLVVNIVVSPSHLSCRHIHALVFRHSIWLTVLYHTSVCNINHWYPCCNGDCRHYL